MTRYCPKCRAERNPIVGNKCALCGTELVESYLKVCLRSDIRAGHA